jgi:outer membrane lipoprotein carrier protein
MKPISPTLLAVVVFLGARALAADEDAAAAACVDAVSVAIQSRYEAVSDLSADFEQESRSVALGGSAAGIVTSQGTVVFAKPGKMHWSYEKPEPSVVVSDGETLWVYDPVHAEVQRMSVMGGSLSGAGVQFLLGQGDMRRDFAVRAVACSDDTAELELIPREDATYEKLRILADRVSGELRRTTVFDLVGNVTVVRFRNIRANQRPRDDLFQFEPPQGVEVIDLDGS